MNTTTINTNKFVNDFVVPLTGAILLFACAQITIPLSPVPITMQTTAVMLIALLYNLRNGLRAISIYTIGGAVGAPLFHGGSFGIHVLSGPTGGYLIGFIACIYVMNLIKEKLKPSSLFNLVINCATGIFIIYGCGVAWLTVLFGFSKAITVGLMPFIAPETIKVLLLSSILKAIFRTK